LNRSDESRRTPVARRPWPFYAASTGEAGLSAPPATAAVAVIFSRARNTAPPESETSAQEKAARRRLFDLT